jgi:hypothetical protein
VDTEYTNDNSFPIDVSISMSASSDLSAATFLVNGTTVISVDPTSGRSANFTVTVPPKQTYKVNVSSESFTVHVWVELR